MSFDTVANGIKGILQSNGFAESLESTDFKDAPSQEYGNTFILDCVSGEAGEANDEQSAQLYDTQKWTVQIAFNSSANSGEQLDAIHRKRDILLAELDDPANWKSFAPILRYLSWAIEKRPDYIILTINLKVIDVLTY